jgi:large subunit ribosomal protein L30
MPSRLKITLVKSPIGYRQDQKDTVRALGLGPKMWRTVIKNDTPDIRGMVNKVRHLVRVEAFEEEPEAPQRARRASAKPKTAEAPAAAALPPEETSPSVAEEAPADAEAARTVKEPKESKAAQESEEAEGGTSL